MMASGVRDTRMATTLPAREQDLELARRLSSGDKLAMKSVYETYSDGVYKFAKSWLADPFDASDIVHETMLAVWKQADRFHGRSSLKSWIYAIARNKAVDHNRKKGRSTTVAEMPEQVDDALGPSASLAALQDANRMRAAIAQLKETHRSVIHLAFFEELPYAEIAEIEGVPVGTVKTRVMHAKSKLQHILAREGGR